MNLPYSIRMYWTNFWQPTIHVQQNIFEKTLIEVGSSLLYASFGIFWVQIDQLVKAQWDFKLSEEFEIDVIFLRKQRFYRFHTFFKKTLCLEYLTNLDAKGTKRSVKVWATNFYKSFFKNILLYMNVGCQKFVQYIQSGPLNWRHFFIIYFRNSLHKAIKVSPNRWTILYIWSKVDSCFCEFL